MAAKFNQPSTPGWNNVTPLSSGRTGRTVAGGEASMSRELLDRILDDLLTKGRSLGTLAPILQSYDTSHNEKLTLADFRSAMSEAGLPLSKLEVA